MPPYDQELEELYDWLRRNYSAGELNQWSRTLIDIHKLPVSYDVPND